MAATTTPASATITCAKPSCGTSTTPAEATYVDGLGHICPTCAEPSPRLVERSRPAVLTLRHRCSPWCIERPASTTLPRADGRDPDVRPGARSRG